MAAVSTVSAQKVNNDNKRIDETAANGVDHTTVYVVCSTDRLELVTDLCSNIDHESVPDVAVSSWEDLESIQAEHMNLSVFSGLENDDLILVYGDVVLSTQTLLKEAFGEVAAIPGVNVLFAASIQTHGVGRGNNRWESKLGVMMMTFSFQLESAVNIHVLQYMGAVSTVAACKSFQKDVPVYIKWPNDIIGKTENESLKKFGGMLFETRQASNGCTVVLGGIGLNISGATNMVVDTTCLNDLLPSGSEDVTRPQCMVAIYQDFMHKLETWNQDFANFQSEYESMWLHAGQQVFLEQKQGYVTIVGLDPENWYMKAVSENDQEEFMLHPNGNTFDMTAGLIGIKK